MKTILVAGELNADLILHGYRDFPAPGKEILVEDFDLALGGASSLCAAGLGRLGTPTAFIARVGRDPWTEFCLEILRARKIDISRVITSADLKSGITIAISNAHDRALVTYLGAIAALTADDVLPHLDGFNHVHVSSFFLQHALRPRLRALFAAAHARGLTTSLDPGFDPAEKWQGGLHEVLTEVDLFFPNEVELAALSGKSDPEAGLLALANGRTRVVAKLGAKGAISYAPGSNEVLVQPAFSVTPIDTTGAGDSFNAGYLHAFLRGFSPRDCLRFGAACGALSTQKPGGAPGQPDAEEVAAFLRLH